MGTSKYNFYAHFVTPYGFRTISSIIINVACLSILCQCHLMIYHLLPLTVRAYALHAEVHYQLIFHAGLIPLQFPDKCSLPNNAAALLSPVRLTIATASAASRPDPPD